MIDPVTYRNTIPNNKVVPVIKSRVDVKEMSRVEKMLLRPYAYGFGLGDKTWGRRTLSPLTPMGGLFLDFIL